MQFSTTALLLAIVPLSLATTCTQSNALPWTFGADGTSTGDAPGSGGSGGSTGSSGVDACAAQCGQNQACVTQCLANVEQGECNSVGGSACPGGIDGNPNTDDPSDGLIKRLSKRALTCTSSQACYQYTDGSLLCLDRSTGEYDDDVGGYGNAISGLYTAPDGEQIVVSAGRTSTIRAATASSAIGAGAAATHSSTSAFATSASTSPSRSGSAASATSSTASRASAATETSPSQTSTSPAAATSSKSAAAGALRAGSLLGAVGLVAGLVL